MFKRTPSPVEQSLDAYLAVELDALNREDDDYLTKVEAIERLYKLRTDPKSEWVVSPEALLTIAGNLLGILMIIGHEQIGNVVTSKAFGLVLKPR